MGLVAPRHVGSSQTRARTHVPCIGRQILNHCATREAQGFVFFFFKPKRPNNWNDLLQLSELKECSSYKCQFHLMLVHNWQYFTLPYCNLRVTIMSVVGSVLLGQGGARWGRLLKPAHQSRRNVLNHGSTTRYPCDLVNNLIFPKFLITTTTTTIIIEY